MTTSIKRQTMVTEEEAARGLSALFGENEKEQGIDALKKQVAEMRELVLADTRQLVAMIRKDAPLAKTREEQQELNRVANELLERSMDLDWDYRGRF
jgi:hypothetical protein